MDLGPIKKNLFQPNSLIVGANAVSGLWSVIEFFYSYHEGITMVLKVSLLCQLSF